MTWSLSAAGHAADADAEQRVIDILRQAMADTEAGSAALRTAHHGAVDLLASAGQEE